MRRQFNKSLHKLEEDLMEMAMRVEEALQLTVRALKEHDADIAREVREGDEQINAMAHALEQNCMYIITRQQPIARDLRLITSTLKDITNLEEIGDHCADICEIIVQRESTWSWSDLPYDEMISMLETAHTMYKGAIETLTSGDEEQALLVCKQDDIVDECFNHLVLEISSIMGKKPNLASEAVDDIMIVKYIERLADHAEDIAKWSIYLETGVHPGF